MNSKSPLVSKSWPYYEGQVTFNDHMGNDLTVVNAARVSFNKRVDVLEKKDEKLIHYLAEHKHMSPFRHVQFTLTLEDISEVVLRQLYKHQVGIAHTSDSFREVATVWNEVSGRYVEFEPKFHVPRGFREQNKSNKQASTRDVCLEGPDLADAQSIYRHAVDTSFFAYKSLLSLGVCREQARMVLSIAFTTSAIWTASLEALVHFVRLRKHEGAQVEIQDLALIVEEIVRSVCPVSVAALLEEKSTTIPSISAKRRDD